MNTIRFQGWSCRFVFLIVVLLLPLAEAHAVPSYARQTGMDCTACHTVFPELTYVGRSFKVNGYTMTNVSQMQTQGLKENYYPPVSAMLLVSYTSLNKSQPDTQNGNVLLPDQLSLFYAGRISDKLGAYAQVTYSQAQDHFSMDNTDIRYADSYKDLTYGLTFNNNPTVQDLWNSTPAWGFPFVSSGVAPTPAAASQIDHTLAQQVAGIGLFGYLKNMIYAEATFYRSSQVGQPQPPDATSTNTISGTVPYWRLALEQNWGNHSLEVGTYGTMVNIIPGPGVTGPSDRFRDYAFDAQYQYVADRNILTAHTTWIYEKQEWDASLPAGDVANSTDRLKTFKVDGTYYYNRLIGGSLGYFAITGTADVVKYAPASVTGSASGTPNSNGLIFEVDYLPWLNTKFGVQYVAYNKFNGGDSNYDGSGRNASDNNTLYVYGWMMF